MACALELRNISKSFGDALALVDVSLQVAPGTIHALVGENGAGKSTLLRVAYGELRTDEGRVAVHGQTMPADYAPSRAISAGVGLVHQHFMLVGPLTVAENVVLGAESRSRRPWRGLVSPLDASCALRQLGARLGMVIDPAARVEDLSVGEQQRVEILKVLWRGADVLLLDEPTAVLTPTEAGDLLGVLRRLSAEGKTVVLVSHKLDEIAEVADRVTVLRRGEIVADFRRADADPGAIAEAMIGRPWRPEGKAMPVQPAGEVLLEVQGLRVGRPWGADAVADLELTVGSGEVLGIAGVEGNGQSELVLALAGLTKPLAGTVRMCGREVTHRPARARARLGLGHVPEDRLLRGVIQELTVAENLILGRQREFARPFGLDRRSMRDHARTLIAEFDISPKEPDALASALSGGNQQKLILARELTRPNLRVLLAAQPTRGVDVAAADLVRRRILSARDAGVAVLVVSSDLDELRFIADRIAVMVRGRIVGTLARDEATSLALGQLMASAASEAAA